MALYMIIYTIGLLLFLIGLVLFLTVCWEVISPSVKLRTPENPPYHKSRWW